MKLNYEQAIHSFMRTHYRVPGNKKIKAFRRRKSALMPFPRPDADKIHVLSGTKYKVQPNGSWKRLEAEA